MDDIIHTGVCISFILLVSKILTESKVNKYFVWSDFDRASSLLCGNKVTTRCNRWYLLQILLHAQHVSGNTMPIIRSTRVLYRWSLPVVFGALVFRLWVWCGADHLYNTLVLLMMGIVLPETCWACNKICNKYHLLHLIVTLFPHNKYFVIIKVFYLPTDAQ